MSLESIGTGNSFYLENSHGMKLDYHTTAIGGDNNILSTQAEKKFGDWRDEFFTKGYTVIKGAISRERALSYRQQALNWLLKLNLGLDYNDKCTWNKDHLPVMMNGGMILNYAAAHEKWVWETRWYDAPITLLIAYYLALLLFVLTAPFF